MDRSKVINRLAKLTADATGGPVNYTSFPLEEFDREIRRMSQGSAKAPAEFLEAELRKDLNYWLLNHGDSVLRGTLPLPEIGSKFTITRLEENYQAYFDTQAYYRTLTNMTLDPDNFTIIIPQNWPEPVNVDPDQPPPFKELVGEMYGSDKKEVKTDLVAYGLPSALRTLGFGNPFNPVKEVYSTELPEMARRYLIALGGLYPQSEKVIIHPNMILGNSGWSFIPGIQPNLNEDGLPLVQNYIKKYQNKIPRTDAELWDYFGYLLCFQIGGRQEIYAAVMSQFLKAFERGNEDDGIELDPIPPEKMDRFVALGRRFVPQRYLELEPKIEKFEWYFPEVSAQG